MKSSSFEYNEIQNSVSESKVFVRIGVFSVQLINETGFEIIVGDRMAGDIRVPSKDKVTFLGHPLFPTEIRYRVQFNPAAPTTDFLKIITSSVYVLDNKEC